MCGILALAGPNRLADGDALARIMTHRGPDDRGVLTADAGPARVTLAHRRLAIIDLSERGHQPMTAGVGGPAIVFNGEIYNFQDIRADLEKRGHHFHSRTDTEVLLHAYLEWGEACLEKLAGMWAFVIWDPARRTLFGARDRFGIKPLYYADAGGRFAAASEIKAIWSSGEYSTAPNFRRILDYFLFNLHDHSADTLFEHIHQVLPAHAFRFEIEHGRLTHWKYWNPPESVDRSLKWNEAVGDLRERLVRSVREHLVADVPVGFCLSGGIDSSTIVGVARAVRGNSGPLVAFTSAYDNSPFDERAYVDEVVRSKDIEGHVVIPTPDRMEEDLDRLVYFQDEPPVHSSVYAQWCVMRLAREHGVTVILDGQGADELFAGYPAHRDVRAADLLAEGHFEGARHIGSPLRGIYALTPAALKTVLFRFKSDAWKALAPDARRALPSDALTNTFESFQYRDLSKRLFKDTFELHLQKLLHYEDRNSMAFSIESRVPFLDHRIAELALAMPVEWRLSERGSKWALREAAREFLPEKIAKRQDKIGFATPQREWLSQLLRRRGDLLEEGWAARTLVSETAIADLRKKADDAAYVVIWKIICLNIWHRIFFEGGAKTKVEEMRVIA